MRISKKRRPLFLLPLLRLIAAPALLNADIPDWFTPLRDAVYEQRLKADEILPLFRETEKRAETSLAGGEQYIMLSRCEYMMGRAYQYEERKKEAAARYERGIAWAEKSLDVGAGAEGWRMLAENIAQSCAVRPPSYAMVHGLKVEGYAKSALTLDAQNGAALYLLAARSVYAPPPFNDLPRGIRMLEEILAAGNRLSRDDLFNVYSAIGYAWIKQKKYAQARPWLEKSLDLYPTNRFVLDLLAETTG
jgi:tetratricopeptide (TPR) repeat protein